MSENNKPNCKKCRHLCYRFVGDGIFQDKVFGRWTEVEFRYIHAKEGDKIPINSKINATVPISGDCYEPICGLTKAILKKNLNMDYAHCPFDTNWRI